MADNLLRPEQRLAPLGPDATAYLRAAGGRVFVEVERDGHLVWSSPLSEIVGLAARLLVPALPPTCEVCGAVVAEGMRACAGLSPCWFALANATSPGGASFMEAAAVGAALLEAHSEADLAPTPTTAEDWPWPWRKPISHYDTAGPEEWVRFTMHGVWLAVAPTDKIGCDTGRTRFKVECLTCGELLHPATTGPAFYCESHLRGKHGAP